MGRFFDNLSFIPRFADNLFQLHCVHAFGEVARFGINKTLGVGGLFDVADDWFGIEEHDNDFDLTLGYYGVPQGWYVIWPFLEALRPLVTRLAWQQTVPCRRGPISPRGTYATASPLAKKQ